MPQKRGVANARVANATQPNIVVKITVNIVVKIVANIVIIVKIASPSASIVSIFDIFFAGETKWQF